MAASDNRGQWHAQGADIEEERHCETWNCPTPPTKADAYEHLATVSSLCTASQRKLREGACRKARKYVARAPKEGIPGHHMKRFPVKSTRIKSKGAAIDLEITTGYALCGDPVKEV